MKKYCNSLPSGDSDVLEEPANKYNTKPWIQKNCVEFVKTFNLNELLTVNVDGSRFLNSTFHRHSPL